MTASEAREAAAWHRAEAEEVRERRQYSMDYARESGHIDRDEWLARKGAEYDAKIAQYDRAAVALDAYADGIDGGEWTPIGTSFEFRPTSADTNRLHRIRARLLDLVPLDGTMSMADDVQRLDRALADAEARGRHHGLFESWCAVAAEREAEVECYRRSRGQDGGEYWKGVVDTTDETLARVVALAAEATDGR